MSSYLFPILLLVAFLKACGATAGNVGLPRFECLVKPILFVVGIIVVLVLTLRCARRAIA